MVQMGSDELFDNLYISRRNIILYGDHFFHEYQYIRISVLTDPSPLTIIFLRLHSSLPQRAWHDQSICSCLYRKPDHEGIGYHGRNHLHQCHRAYLGCSNGFLLRGNQHNSIQPCCERERGKIYF